MTLETLTYIASDDSRIKLLTTDVALGDKHKSVYGGETTFDPVISAASNPELLADSKNDFWTKYKPNMRMSSKSKRKFGRFDKEKFTKYFINTKGAYLDDEENKPDIARTGFDAYSYLMAYENDILKLYTDEEMSKLEKAALHFIEFGNEIVDLDYLKYIASHDDLIVNAVESLEEKPEDIEQVDWLKDFGKKQYETDGRTEIEAGSRTISDFFDPVMYAASYPAVKDMLMNAEGVLDEGVTTITYILHGFGQGLKRNVFAPFLYLANYPEMVKEDVYDKKSLDPRKVAKVWLTNWTPEIQLDKFDVDTFVLSKGLEEGVDGFRVYVEEKVDEYMFSLKSKLFKFKFPLKCVRRPEVNEEETKESDETEEKKDKEV
tara:strand:+ start:561 stop:1688 length:1128 start_codon:yes stop_codon:yes gene_type:complete